MQIDENFKKIEKGELFTDFEKKVIDLSEKIIDSYRSEKEIIVRICGGSIRDKLLDVKTYDVDLSVEGITGEEFARKVEEITDKNGDEDIGVIRNREKSSHLASAKICFRGENLSVDVMGLRHDSYSDDTRVPTITTGTPKQDAERRDFTINTLFYNINTKKIEDFLGGVDDLKNKRLRTTYDTELSFSDDPLRILRLLRFSAKYLFPIDDTYINAVKKSKEAYKTKVNVERAGVEIRQSLSNPNTDKYIEYVIKADMFELIFDPLTHWNLDKETVLKNVKKVVSRQIPDECKMYIVLGAIFYQLAYLDPIQDPLRKKCLISPIECAILRDMKFTSNTAASVQSFVVGTKIITDIYKSGELKRLTVGKLVNTLGTNWEHVCYLLLDDAVYNYFKKDIVSFITSENLAKCVAIQPLMRGNDIAKILGINASKEIAKLTKEMIEWQIENPNGTAEEYKNIIKSRNK